MAKSTQKNDIKQKTNEDVAAKVVEETQAATPTTTLNSKTYKVKRDIPLNAIIPVRNGFNGSLVYRSPRTNETYVWEGFGSEQDMELQELKNARNSYKSFFENNWFLISDPEIIEYLGVGQYYKNALTYENFDSIYKLDADEIEDRVSKLSDGQKATVRYRAKQLIDDGTIDSIKVITALEKSLGVELIER